MSQHRPHRNFITLGRHRQRKTARSVVSLFDDVEGRGLAAKYLQATQVLYETKSIPAPVPFAVIEEAIDASALKQYATSSRTK